jgi:hypothetical protein
MPIQAELGVIRELGTEFQKEGVGNAEINLINQRQILVPFGVLDFVDSNSVDLAEYPVLQPEGDDVFHSIENLFP